MAELNLTGGAAPRRNMLVPILLALVVLAALGAWFAKVFLHPSVEGTVTRTDVYPVHTVFAKPFGTVGDAQSEDALYVVAHVTLTDRVNVPLFLKEIAGSFISEDDAQYQANVIGAKDLPRLGQMFPRLKSITDTAGQPLATESSVPPGGTGTGYVVMLFNIPQSVWDKRKSAAVRVAFYHQDTIAIAIPK